MNGDCPGNSQRKLLECTHYALLNLAGCVIKNILRVGPLCRTYDYIQSLRIGDRDLAVCFDLTYLTDLSIVETRIGVVPYALPSSVQLADLTLELVKKHDVVLWEKHGTVAVGTDMMEAFDQTDVLNKAACIYMAGKNFGFTPEGMTREAVQEIRDVFKLPDNK